MKQINKIILISAMLLVNLIFNACADTEKDLLNENVSQLKSIYSSPIALKSGLDDGWEVIDENNDGYTWYSEVDPDTKNYRGVGYIAYISSNRTHADWLISPPLYLEAGKEYTISFYSKKEDYRGPETYVYIASYDIDELDLNDRVLTVSYYSMDYRYNSIKFTPDKTDKYYIYFEDNSAYNCGPHGLVGLDVSVKE